MKKWCTCILNLFCLVGFAVLVHAHMDLLAGVSPGRIEVLHPGGREAMEAAAAHAGLQDTAWEDDRMVVEGAGLFTGAALEAGLLLTGQDAEAAVVLDYAWADEVLEQSARLWQIPGAVLLLWLLWRLVRFQIGLELSRGREGLEHMYMTRYLDHNAVRLLAKTVLFAMSLFMSVLLLRWLWRIDIFLPPDFLPEGSIFQEIHYQQWMAEHFPLGLCSQYGLCLTEVLRQTHTLAALECLALLPPAIWAGTTGVEICMRAN